MAHATQSYLAGDWQMVRIIENVADGVIGEIWGEARFMPDGAGLRCVETGVMRFQGVDYHDRRVSLWRFAEGGCVEVLYEDGRAFHDFLNDAPIALAIEGEASFRIEYAFERGAWSSVWNLDAPGAAYRMTTSYRR